MKSGDQVRLLLSGQRGSYSIDGMIVSLTPTEVVLVIGNTGKSLSIPLQNVVSSEFLEATTSHKTDLPREQQAAIARLQESLAYMGSTQQRLQAVERALDVFADELSVVPGVKDGVNAISVGVAQLRSVAGENDLRARRTSRTSARSRLHSAMTGLAEVPPEVVRALLQAVDHCLSLEETAWQLSLQRSASCPEIDADEETVAILMSGGILDISLRVRLPGVADYIEEQVERIIVHLVEGADNLRQVGRNPELPALRVGQAGTVGLRVRAPHAMDGGRINLALKLTYEGVDGELHETGMQRVPIRVREAFEFSQLPNPYLQYASGNPVDDKRMFFGREEVIAQVSERVLIAPGSGVAVYGQQRTGKTSLLRRVAEKVKSQSRSVIPVELSAAIFKSGELGLATAFAQEFDAELQSAAKARLKARGKAVLSGLWPTLNQTRSQKPLQYVRACVRAAEKALETEGVANPLIVVFVDEFQYVYRDLRNPRAHQQSKEDVRDFMTQWKALLEARLFSAVIAGQDTLPLMFEAFPNEFSTMWTYRMTYLTKKDTRKLALVPFDKVKSPFVGHSIDEVYSFTGGHPFLTQALCSRIVERANAHRSSFVTDRDVRDAVNSLIKGDERLPDQKFACFYTADQTGVLAVPDNDTDLMYEDAGPRARKLLVRLARSADSMGIIDLESLSLTDEEERLLVDLHKREVVVMAGRDSLLRIRVRLLLEYLRGD